MEKFEEITVLVQFDAWGKYALPYTDFLRKLGSRHYISYLEGVLGFQSIVGAWCAGLYPESSDLFSIFVYSPDTSPFKLFKNKIVCNVFKFSEYIIDILFKYFKPDRLVYHSPGYIIRYISAKMMNKTIYKSKPYITFAEVPYELLPYFDISEKKRPTEHGYIPNKPTIFDVCNEHNKKWLYYGSPDSAIFVNNRQQIASVKDKLLKNRYDFVFLHIADLDGIGHVYGPYSNEVRITAKKVDKFIEEIFFLLKKKYKRLNMIVFGDHGMVEVNEYINIIRRIKNTSLDFGRDYVMFVDSPFVRFWFLNDKAEKVILNELANINSGKILTDKDYKKYKIRFKHNKYYEAIFLLKPGSVFYPNFFQYKIPVKGMHGYCPFYEDNQGLFLFYSDKINTIKLGKSVRMVDIFPTILDLIELPIPQTSEGRSLIR